ncbi:hypothetical protein BJY04DRAFT_129977 [Aspergillus karnatakaensis]|uniref:F-box domain protein n=1 Tax=Aspergillus karnatakaensis TaxID=1810916 RepID=UPI003CCCE5FF
MDPQSDIHEIVVRFKRLGTTSTRRIAYHQIIDQLTPYEWRDVKDRIEKRTFQRDILGELPLELALHIIRYLSIADVHRLRRVSRRWFNLLSSKAACNTMFQMYTGGLLDDTNGDFKSAFAGYSKQRHRLEQGHPSRKSYIGISFLSGLNPDFSAGRYVFPTDGNTTLEVFDLASWQFARFCTENRERFEQFRISESITAAITSRGYCHVWELVTKQAHSLRLPSRNVSLFNTSGFRLALYLGSGQSATILHYDAQSQKTHTIQHVPEVAFIGMKPSSRDLVVLSLGQNSERVSNKTPGIHQLHVRRHRLLEGGYVSTVRAHTQELPLPRDCGWTDFKIRYDLQDDCKNSMAIFQARPASKDSTHEYLLPVTYHPDTDEICVHILPGRYLARPLCIANVDKDILYWMKNENGRRNIWISNPYADIPIIASRSLDLGLPRDLANGVSLLTDGHYTLLGDSRFVSMIDAAGTRIWYFEDEEEHQEVQNPGSDT